MICKECMACKIHPITKNRYCGNLPPIHIVQFSYDNYTASNNCPINHPHIRELVEYKQYLLNLMIIVKKEMDKTESLSFLEDIDTYSSQWNGFDKKLKQLKLELGYSL